MKFNSKQGGNQNQGRDQTSTYKLNDIETDPGIQGCPNNPFTLPLRVPGWFPDGVDLPWQQVQRLFSEEVIGTKSDATPIPFGVRFCEPSSSSSSSGSSSLCPGTGSPGKPKKKTYPQQWMLGDRICEPAPQSNDLMCLICDLAIKVRKYNASLYRLRRLHFWYKYNQNTTTANRVCPCPNPRGGEVENLPPPNSPDFASLVAASEQDWAKVTTDLNNFIETATNRYKQSKSKLLAADMIEVNGYVVSMRVVTTDYTPPGQWHPRERGGSSSHVSISSAFSSS